MKRDEYGKQQAFRTVPVSFQPKTTWWVAIHGSLTVSVFINAAAQASPINPVEIRSRNEALNVQLQNK